MSNYFGEMRMATCHPDRQYYSKGLCKLCYGDKMRAKYKNKHKALCAARKRLSSQPSAEYVYSKSPIVDIPDMIKDDYWIRYDCKLPKLIIC